MKQMLIALALAAALLALLVAPPLAGAATGLQPTVLTQFSPGEWGAFAEGMAADSHGDLIVSLTTWGYYDETVAYSNIGEIWKVTPAGDAMPLATDIDLTPYGMLMGLAIDGSDRVYVGLWDMSGAFGLPDGIGSGVFRLETGGVLARVASLPSDSWPNGLAFHEGSLYVSDSARGAIWRIDVNDAVGAPQSPWFQSSLLAPSKAASGSGIGANGLAFKGDALYTAVSDFGRVVRVPVKSDGTAGAPTLLCKRPELRSADGIAFDILGRLWIVTNGSDATPSGGVFRVARDGTVREIAKDPGWLNYPTTPVFSRAGCTATTLFVENGAYYSFADGSAPDIVSLQAGLLGLPLR